MKDTLISMVNFKVVVILSWIRGEMTGTIYEGNFIEGKYDGHGILDNIYGR